MQEAANEAPCTHTSQVATAEVCCSCLATAHEQEAGTRTAPAHGCQVSLPASAPPGMAVMEAACSAQASEAAAVGTYGKTLSAAHVVQVPSGKYCEPYKGV